MLRGEIKKVEKTCQIKFNKEWHIKRINITQDILKQLWKILYKNIDLQSNKYWMTRLKKIWVLKKKKKSSKFEWDS